MMGLTTYNKIMSSLEVAVDNLCIGIIYNNGWCDDMSNRIAYLFQCIESKEIRRHVTGNWKRYRNQMIASKIQYWRNQGPESPQVKKISYLIQSWLQGPAWDREVHRLTYFSMKRLQSLRHEGRNEEADRLGEKLRVTIDRMIGTCAGKSTDRRQEELRRTTRS